MNFANYFLAISALTAYRKMAWIVLPVGSLSPIAYIFKKQGNFRGYED